MKIQYFSNAESSKYNICVIENVSSIAMNGETSLAVSFDTKNGRERADSIETRTILSITDDKETPMVVTHEATIQHALTCPRCKNVVNRFEWWGNTRISIVPNYCPHCGQRITKQADKKLIPQKIDRKK